MIFGYFKKDRLLGGCVVYSYKKFLFLSIAASNVQLTPYGGIILSPFESLKVRENENIQREIISAINNELVKNFNIISLINSPGLSDIRPFVYQGWKERVYYAYVKSLDGDILLNVSRQVRTNIRKAHESGIIVKKEYDPEIFWQLVKKTFEKQNLKPPFQKEYVLGIMEMLINNNLGEMWIARTKDGIPASADFIIWDNRQAHRWMAASDEQLKGTSATTLLIFEILQDLQKRNFHWINMMSGNLSNLSAFNSSFSPKLIPYYKVEKKSRNTLLNFLINMYE